MDYETLWRILSDLVAELRRSEETVPAEAMRDLRSAKTMIEILKADQSRFENLLRIEEYLNNVESLLLPAAKKRFGNKYFDEWVTKIAEAHASIHVREPEPQIRFPIGAPRDKHWVRIRPSETMPAEKVEQLSEESGVKCETQEDGYVLIYGEEEKVRAFVKKTAETLRENQCQSVLKSMRTETRHAS